MTSKRKDKKYRPRQVVMNPTEFFLGGYKLIEPETQTEANVKNHLALLRLATDSDKSHFDTLVEMINTSIVLCEKTFKLKYHAELLEARDCLKSVGDRARETGIFKINPSEVGPIYTAVIINEEMLRVSRVIDFERAYDEVKVRLQKSSNVIKI